MCRHATCVRALPYGGKRAPLKTALYVDFLPLLLAVGTATVVARTIDRRLIYDARFTDKEVKDLQQARAPSAS